MAVTGTDRKQTFNMDGAVLDFDFTFRALTSAPEDIKCKLITEATGAETDLTYLTDYTVSIESDGVGGTVTVTDPQSTAYQLLVYRETTNTQESDYDDYSSFPADTLDNDLDKRTLVSQEQDEILDRCMKAPISTSLSSLELPTPEADKLLGWNAAATAIENKVALDDDIQAACEAAQAGAELAEDGAQAAQALAEYARDAAEAVAGFDMATQEQAETGTDNTTLMTPLRTSQNVAANLIDEDDMASDSAVKAPTQQSVKYYVDNYGMPSGVIVMWSGAIVNIPTGWYLCDGNNGTPNLQDKFIVGAGSTYAVAATGGAATHTLSKAEMPAHTHGITIQGGGATIPTYDRTTTASASTGTTSSAGSGSAHNNLPPYYALAYIMKG